jgi:hypothetical protein
MSYGLTAINGSNYVQIDSETPRLCSLYNGTYQATSDHYARVYFPAPITTSEPPCIFIRNDPSRPNDLYYKMTLYGSPGNWTGFEVMAANVTFRPLGKWFAAVFASVAKNSYGLRIWNAGGGLCYDSGAIPVIVTRANHSWAYAGSAQLPDYGAQYYWQNGSVGALASDEYFMINPFSRGLLRPQNNGWINLGVRFNYNENRLQLYCVALGAGPWTDNGQPAAVFARLPGT